MKNYNQIFCGLCFRRLGG